MSATWKLPPAISLVSVVHLTGFMAVAAGVCVWGYLLTQPVATMAPREFEPPVIVADAASEAIASWFGPEPVRLDVDVIGLVRRENRAVAVLSINGAPPKAYMPGELLLNNVTLRSIEYDGITVERAGVISQIAAPVLSDTGIDGIKRVPKG